QPLLVVAQGVLAALALVRRGVGQLGAEAGQIALHRREGDGSRLDGDVIRGLAQGEAQLADLRGDHRLTAGDDDVARRILGQTRDDVAYGERLPFWWPGGERGITPGTAEGAARGAYEGAGDAHEDALALDRIEDLRHPHPRQFPRGRMGQYIVSDEGRGAR